MNTLNNLEPTNIEFQKCLQQWQHRKLTLMGKVSTGVATWMPCRPGPTTFSRMSKNWNIQKMQYKLKANGGEGWAPSNIDIKVSNRLTIPSECTITALVFKVSSAVPNRFQCRQNALFTDIVFKNVFCSCKSFQTLSKCMLKGHCFQNVLCCSRLFKYRQHACLRDIAFKMFSAVPNRFNYTFIMHTLETLPLVAIHHLLLFDHLVIVFWYKIIVSNKPEHCDVL